MYKYLLRGTARWANKSCWVAVKCEVVWDVVGATVAFLTELKNGHAIGILYPNIHHIYAIELVQILCEKLNVAQNFQIKQ